VCYSLGAVLKRLGSFSIATLVAFHACLFGKLLVEGRITSPERALPWAAALALFVAFVAVSRSSDIASRRRRLVALWTLAALLHAPATAERIERAPIPVPPTIAIIATGLAPGLFALLLAATLLARAFAAETTQIFGEASTSFFRRAADPSADPDAPRPPPGFQIFLFN
jgi:hypothetical protein